VSKLPLMITHNQANNSSNNWNDELSTYLHTTGRGNRVLVRAPHFSDVSPTTTTYHTTGRGNRVLERAPTSERQWRC